MLFPYGVNWLAVLVAAVVAFGFGALYYSPLLLGKAWTAAHGYTPEQLAEMQKSAGMAYGVTFVCWLVMAAAVAVILHRVGAQTLVGGLKVAALCWLGFAVPVGLSQQAFGGRKYAAWALDAGYQLVSLLLMGVVLALWW
jgi:hypothetical protein